MATQRHCDAIGSKMPGASIPIGVLKARDALQLLLTEVEQEETPLRDYMMCVGYR
ncbi:hypothetical protein [Manganibacter manganicus]|uniref:hypothetical protein n=1 Tax=Manganibacter manganicus TaxID=1873176 RepID=UPI001301F337|nr:hypothetical protein [Pseudaminobacter manganicus]